MIIFFYGPDSFRAREKVRGLKARFIREVDKSGFNVVELEGDKMDINDFNKAVGTQSFLSAKRMVIVRHIGQAKKASQTEVLELLKKKKFMEAKDDNVIVFWDEKPDQRSALFKYLRGSKFCEEFAVLQGPSLVKWIGSRVEEKGGKIDRQAAVKLASKSDGNLWTLAGEIDKMLAERRGEEIGPAQVDEVELVKIDDNIFNITDAIANKNAKQALKLIEDNFDEGMNAIYLLTMIARQFRILLQVKAGMERGLSSSRDLARELGLHPFVAGKAITQAGKYTMEELKKIYAKLLEADAALKSGENERGVIEGFIVSMQGAVNRGQD